MLKANVTSSANKHLATGWVILIQNQHIHYEAFCFNKKAKKKLHPKVQYWERNTNPKYKYTQQIKTRQIWRISLDIFHYQGQPLTISLTWLVIIESCARKQYHFWLKKLNNVILAVSYCESSPHPISRGKNFCYLLIFVQYWKGSLFTCWAMLLH